MDKVVDIYCYGYRDASEKFCCSRWILQDLERHPQTEELNLAASNGARMIHEVFHRSNSVHYIHGAHHALMMIPYPVGARSTRDS